MSLRINWKNVKNIKMKNKKEKFVFFKYLDSFSASKRAAIITAGIALITLIIAVITVYFRIPGGGALSLMFVATLLSAFCFRLWSGLLVGVIIGVISTAMVFLYFYIQYGSLGTLEDMLPTILFPNLMYLILGAGSGFFNQMRRRYQADLLKSESKTKSILSSIGDLVFVYDKEGRYSFYHYPPGGALYVSPEEFIGKKYSDVLPPRVSRKFDIAITENKEGKVSETEYLLEINKKKRHFIAKISPMKYNGDYAGSVAVIRDVTDRYKTRKDMEKINKQLLEKNNELEEINRLMTGREMKMVELKKRIKILEAKLKEK